jgi:hypothetical protein
LRACEAGSNPKNAEHYKNITIKKHKIIYILNICYIYFWIATLASSARNDGGKNGLRRRASRSSQ